VGLEFGVVAQVRDVAAGDEGRLQDALAGLEWHFDSIEKKCGRRTQG
jgi:hypothetical protein